MRALGGGSDGEALEGDEIARRVGRSPRFLDKWRARYCLGGFDAIVPGKAKGQPAKLTPDQDELLGQRLNAGPREEDGVCTLRGKDICRIVEEAFGVTGDSIAMITPTVNTELMQTFIDGLSQHIKHDEHAVLVLDNAGWHRAKALAWPGNVTPTFLPAYSPELNTAENLWQFLRSHQLSKPDVRRLRRHARADRVGLEKPGPPTGQEPLPVTVDRARDSSLIRMNRLKYGSRF